MHPVLQPFVVTPALQVEIQTWLARVASAGGTVPGRSRNAANVFVTQCKEAGIWGLFRRVNLCCGDFLASFIPLLNTSGGSQDTNSGLTSTDYAEDLGWTTDGSTKFINTGYTPTEATGGIACYMRSNISTTAAFIGCRDTTPTHAFRIVFVGGSGIQAAWGSTNFVSDGASGGFSAGFSHVVRRGATDAELYRNGVSAGTLATSVTPASPSASMYVLCQNTAGAAATFCPSGTRVAGYSVDSGMTSTQALVYSDIMRRFQRAMGRAFE